MTTDLWRTQLAYARQLLDLAKFGLDISEERITWALRITGDLA